jgi:hypothetical protein
LQIKSSLSFKQLTWPNFKDLFWNLKPRIELFVLDAPFVSFPHRKKKKNSASFSLMLESKMVF